MAKDPAFLMYYKQWLVSTAGWDADIRGWYINLLCHQADKPDGLPPDLESVAELAGVKNSQFSRFSECWKRTLEAKFKANEQGKLINEKQQTVINNRKEFSEKQAKRGLIGYFIKLTKQHYEVSEDQANELYRALEFEELLPKSKEDRFECYKRTLIAILGNVDVNVIGNVNKGGVGEKSKTEKINQNGKTETGYSGNFKARGEEVAIKRLNAGLSKLNRGGKKDSGK